MVALLLSPEDLKTLVISCKSGHFAGAPLLYRSVEVWLDPLNFDELRYRTDNRPIRFLLTLVNSTLPRPASSLPSRNYAAHLVTLCYGSWSMPTDFNALPLLAEALRFTDRLCHLRLDVTSGSVPILLDIFRRASIIVTPSTMLSDSRQLDRLPLPSLESLRTSRIAIAEAFMQYRAIKTVAIDLSIKSRVLAQFLRTEAPWSPTHLKQLSFHAASNPVPAGLIESVLIAFPRLQHLAVRVTSLCSSAVLTVRFHSLLFAASQLILVVLNRIRFAFSRTYRPSVNLSAPSASTTEADTRTTPPFWKTNEASLLKVSQRGRS